MTTLMQANRQWASRPKDERFTSLTEMAERMRYIRTNSCSSIVSSRSIEAIPADDHRGLMIAGLNGESYSPTNWAFNQLAQLSESPAGYLRTLPSELAADCLNFGFRFKRGIEDVGVLLYKDGESELRAATGPAYGRIWNSEIVHTLIDHVGNGVTGDWKIPGEFGEDVPITKENTTLYAGDRDMFVFLADEARRIEIPNRRGGQPGSLARGFFVRNSEVGKATLSISTFLFDYVCCNRIVWGAELFKGVKIRHTAGAPDRWLEEVEPALISYAESSSECVLDTVVAAQKTKVGDLDKFLASRFGGGKVEAIKTAHQIEEGRPIETLWDVTTAATAYARQMPHQDLRIEMERKAGAVMAMAS